MLVKSVSLEVYMKRSNNIIGPLLLGYHLPLHGDTADEPKVKLEDGDVPQDPLGRTPYTELPPHRDEDQVQLDVNRSFVYYPSGRP